MQYTTREMREYQARRRGQPIAWKSLAEDAALLIAVAAGEITEGAAAQALGCDRVAVRERVNEALRAANALTGTPPDRDLRLETWSVEVRA